MPTDREVIIAMEIYGGSFVQALAVAARCADEHNLAILKGAWPGYWREYTNIAMLRARNMATNKGEA